MITANRSLTHSPSMTGRTTSSATSIIFSTSRPVTMPSRSATAAKHSSGVFPAPAPKARVDPSICTAPDRTARTLLATDRPRFSWPWKPTWASSPSSTTSAATRSPHVLEDHGPGGVDHVHALAAGVGHDPGLAGEHLGWLGVRHHQEADRFQPDLPRQAEVLDGDVGLGAVRGDPDDGDAEIRARLDVVLRAEPGQHQRGDPRPGGGLHRGLHQDPLVGLARSRSCSEEPPSPSPWVTSMTGMPASSSAATMARMCSSVNW